MEFSRISNFFVVLATMAVFVMGVFFVFGMVGYAGETQTAFQNILETIGKNSFYVPPQKLENPPQIIKAVYVTAYSAGSNSYLDYLDSLIDSTEINAVVIDVKGSNGYVSYDSGAEDVKNYNLSNKVIRNIDNLVNHFHSKNVYIIGRIAVFEDPVFAKARPELAVYDKDRTAVSPEPGQRVLWQDVNGLSWMDPASKDVWDYNISLAEDAFYHGFDEINFDYIRFPSDGNAEAMGFPVWQENTLMADTIKNFFEYIRQNLPNEKISADLFGLTTVNTDDMGIGQILENALESFDYVCPMIYPSHYENGFIGYENPAEHPYEVIRYSMNSAVYKKENLLPTQANLAKFRPWLQDFDMGAEYTADMIKQEIKAVEDALQQDYAGFMIWNPKNIYTKEAILN